MFEDLRWQLIDATCCSNKWSAIICDLLLKQMVQNILLARPVLPQVYCHDRPLARATPIEKIYDNQLKPQ